MFAELLEELGLASMDAHSEVLGGGVSSAIVRVRSSTDCLIVKQALSRLRVAEPWTSCPDRSSVEARCAETLAALIPGSVPRVIKTLPLRHAFAMACAPDGSETWKALLQRGVIRSRDGAAVGALLGRIHGRSATVPGLASSFQDRSYFDDLRIDAYFRHARTKHPELGAAFDELIDGLTVGPGLCLVHGDYSPKNILITQSDILLIDHEVAHWGQPAFDVAFVASHLLLKAVAYRWRAEAYVATLNVLMSSYELTVGQDLAPHAFGVLGAHTLGALLLARVDGKSPVEYLQSPADRDLVRVIAHRVMLGAKDMRSGLLTAVDAIIGG